MALEAQALAARARGAYERGRLLAALPLLLVVAPLAALSLTTCGTPDFTLGSSAALVAMLVFLQWRGQDLGRGARVGLAYGALAVLLPVAMHVVGFCCNLDFGGLALQRALCVSSGLVAGFFVARAASRISARSPTEFIVAASFVAAVAGSLGCSHLGFGGMVGVTGGVWLVTLPVLVSRRFA